MKKYIALLLAICLLLVGCSSQKKQTQGENTTQQEQPQQEQSTQLDPADLSGNFIGSWTDQYTGDKYTFCQDYTLTFAPSNSNIIYAGNYTLQQSRQDILLTLGIYVDGNQRNSTYLLVLNGDGMDFLDKDTRTTVATLLVADNSAEGLLQQNIDTTAFLYTPDQALAQVQQTYKTVGEGDIPYEYTYLGVAVVEGKSYYVFNWNAYIGSDPTFISLVLAGCNSDQVCMAKYNGEYIVKNSG